MRSVSEKMGIKKHNIKTLFNKQATRKEVVNVLQQAAKKLDAEDELLLYFSVHGLRVPDHNGDEADDDADEALAFYDLAVDQSATPSSLKGVLNDDRLAELLQQIRGRRVYLIVDACHSGSVNKTLELGLEKASGRPSKGGKIPVFLGPMENALSDETHKPHQCGNKIITTGYRSCRQSCIDECRPGYGRSCAGAARQPVYPGIG